MAKAGDLIIQAAKAQAEGELAVHRANIEVYRTMPAGIGEHSDIVETIEKEMMEIAKYDDILEMLDKYFKDDNKNLLG